MCDVCVHMYTCVCASSQSEQSRQAEVEVYLVSLRSGATWSVSCNDTWQELGGFGLAVLYIHVTANKSQHRLSGRNLSPGATGFLIQDKGWKIRTLPSSCPNVSLWCSLSRQVTTAATVIGWRRSEGGNSVNATGEHRAAWHQVIGAKMKRGCSSETAKGKRKSTELCVIQQFVVPYFVKPR